MSHCCVISVSHKTEKYDKSVCYYFLKMEHQLKVNIKKLFVITCMLGLIFLSQHFHFTLVFTSFWSRSSASCEAEAGSCVRGTYHPSLSGAEQVKVMNLIQVPDKRLLFKATVTINIQMCLPAL